MWRSQIKTRLLLAALAFLIGCSFIRIANADEAFRIEVVEEASGWPVPLVELKTVHGVKFVSDNAGLIAFDLPELMGVETWFSVEGDGYEVPQDGFGNRGVRLTPKRGQSAKISVKRMLPAKRLGRITGGGIFAESQKLGLEKSWHEQGILGCDSVQTAIHGGKLHWAWGDTNVAKYPLGLFHMIGATTSLQPLDSFQPPIRLRFNYVVNDLSAPRVIAEMPGSGPTWLSGFVSLADASGRSRLVATYAKIKPPLTAYERGLCVWNDDQQKFERLLVVWKESDSSATLPTLPEGHPVFWTDDDGEKWVLFGDPFPVLKCLATFEAWSNPETWQTLESQKSVLSRDGQQSVIPHRGSIAFSGFRKKWVCVFTQLWGKPSPLGEIWYAESESPFEKWGSAIKIVTHAKHTFYNPHLHPEFTSSDSPILLFEGTYTTLFSNQAETTPRYDYNQILYRIDLDDRKLIEK